MANRETDLEIRRLCFLETVETCRESFCARPFLFSSASPPFLQSKRGTKQRRYWNFRNVDRLLTRFRRIRVALGSVLAIIKPFTELVTSGAYLFLLSFAMYSRARDTLLQLITVSHRRIVLCPRHYSSILPLNASVHTAVPRRSPKSYRCVLR